MKKIILSTFLLLTSISCSNKVEPIKENDIKTSFSTTVNGKISFDLYGCCYGKGRNKLCTTCEDVIITLDEKLECENKTYDKLIVTNSYRGNIDIYNFGNKTVEIKGNITKPKMTKNNGNLLGIDIDEIKALD